MAASSSLLIILWSFFPWYFWCLLNYTACQWLAGCLQQVLIQLFQCRSWSSEGSIGRWLFTGRRKKTLRKETVSNYLVAACEMTFCNEVLNLCKFSSLAEIGTHLRRPRPEEESREWTHSWGRGIPAKSCAHSSQWLFFLCHIFKFLHTPFDSGFCIRQNPLTDRAQEQK